MIIYIHSNTHMATCTSIILSPNLNVLKTRNSGSIAFPIVRTVRYWSKVYMGSIDFTPTPDYHFDLLLLVRDLERDLKGLARVNRERRGNDISDDRSGRVTGNMPNDRRVFTERIGSDNRNRVGTFGELHFGREGAVGANGDLAAIDGNRGQRDGIGASGSGTRHGDGRMVREKIVDRGGDIERRSRSRDDEADASLVGHVAIIIGDLELDGIAAIRQLGCMVSGSLSSVSAIGPGKGARCDGGTIDLEDHGGKVETRATGILDNQNNILRIGAKNRTTGRLGDLSSGLGLLKNTDLQLIAISDIRRSHRSSVTSIIFSMNLGFIHMIRLRP
nr:MAG TPA: hypothetical protein [Caudoviricetes sp.]